MPKLTLADLQNLENQQTAVNVVNNNSDLIEDAVENTLSRDGTSPNEMNADLDMNSHNILNLPVPASPTEPWRLQDHLDFVDEYDFSALWQAVQDAEAARDASESYRDEADAAQQAAETAQAAAEQAETNAETAETNAETAQQAAEDAQAAAEAAQTNAETAESGALAAQQAAEDAQAAAETAESNAATSESNAAASESNASTSESNAAQSESDADDARIAAEAAQAAAELAADSFDDVYLGPKTSDPTLDNDGNPLVVGQLYWNTSAGALRVYDGATWQNYNPTTGVTGQASSVDGEIALFDGTSGTAIKRANSSGILKATSGVIGTATSGTDYAPATSGSGILKGNGTGGFSAATAGTDYYNPGGTDVAIADGGTGASTASTAFDALKQAATDSYTGVVELATIAETVTGTDTARATTPAGVAGAAIFGTIPLNSQSTAYTLVASDQSKMMFHPSSDNNARTFTIPANSSVAFPVGTVISFANKRNTLSIAITSDTLTQAPSGSTGTRTLAANGIATATKIASTEWLITGVGLT